MNALLAGTYVSPTIPIMAGKKRSAGELRPSGQAEGSKNYTRALYFSLAPIHEPCIVAPSSMDGAQMAAANLRLVSSGDLPFHPLADLFPLVEGAEFDELVSSIKENGLLEPIVLFDGSILDGRNRYRACKAAGIAPQTEIYSGNDPVQFVIAKNIHRRHLTASQRGMIGAELCHLRQGETRRWNAVHAEKPRTISVGEAASALNISPDTIHSAKVVLAHGTEEEIAAVRAGELGVNNIARQITKNLSPEARAERRLPDVRDASRSRTREMQVDIWAKLKLGLEGLTALPLPSDVANIARGNVQRRAVVEAKLAQALDWLKEFSDAWNRDDA